MGSRPILLWLGAGIGVVLLYAAYKGKSPASIFTGAIQGKSATPVAPPQAPESANAAEHATLSSEVTTVNGLHYTTDQYGNPVALLPGAYQTSPNTYQPPNTVNA